MAGTRFGIGLLGLALAALALGAGGGAAKPKLHRHEVETMLRTHTKNIAYRTEEEFLVECPSGFSLYGATWDWEPSTAVAQADAKYGSTTFLLTIYNQSFSEVDIRATVVVQCVKGQTALSHYTPKHFHRLAKPTKHSTEVTIEPLQTVEGELSCPSGSVLTGLVPQTTKPGLGVTELYPTSSTGQSWTYKVKNKIYPGTETASDILQSVCQQAALERKGIRIPSAVQAKPPHRLRFAVAEATSAIPAMTNGAPARADCKTGSVPVAGGFRSDGHAFPTGATRLDANGYTAWFNTGGIDASMTVYAVCLGKTTTASTDGT